MINPSFDREKQKAKCFQILGEATGKFRGRLLLLCAPSQELNDALDHVQQAVTCAMKAIEIALDAKDEDAQ